MNVRVMRTVRQAEFQEAATNEELLFWHVTLECGHIRTRFASDTGIPVRMSCPQCEVIAEDALWKWEHSRR